METSRWVLVHNDTIKDNFTLSYPQYKEGPEENIVPPYVCIKSGRKTVVLKTERRIRASGNHVWVSGKVLTDLSPDRHHLSEIEWTKASEKRHRRYKIWRKPSYRWALFGMGIGIVGVVIDASLKIGAAGFGLTLPHIWIGVLMVTSPCLTLAGLVVTFWKGVLE